MAEPRPRESIGSQILHSSYTRLVLLGCFVLLLIALLANLPQIIQGKVSSLDIGKDIATITILGFILLASSTRQSVRDFFNKAIVVNSFWVLVIIYSLLFVDTPLRYWVLGFIGILLIWRIRRKMR